MLLSLVPQIRRVRRCTIVVMVGRSRAGVKPGGTCKAVAALAFARSLGEFGVTIMVAGNIPGRTQTVAVAIYDAVESGNGSLARVLVIIISALALAILAVVNRLNPNPFGTRV